MHIAEGFLPPMWALFWYIVAVPIVAYGAYKTWKLIKEDEKKKVLVAVAGAFIFVLSALKMPSVTGSCSHPTGTGLAVVLFGPAVTAFLSSLVLLYQAILLAHGGITTLGANITSMGIAGPLVGWLFYIAFKRLNHTLAVFLAVAMADLFTYVITSLQLALAFPGESVLKSFETFLAIFAVTQVPLAVIEAIVALGVFKYFVEPVYLAKGVAT